MCLVFSTRIDSVKEKDAKLIFVGWKSGISLLNFYGKNFFIALECTRGRMTDDLGEGGGNKTLIYLVFV